ncbi:MAG: hypothetical protein JWN07_1362 [Hyphomicrobiales bacterium]|nr:hypothetical protein [Hyphomicrobiales bacterium]
MFKKSKPVKLKSLRVRARSTASFAACGLLGFVFSAALPAQTQNAVANGDTRTINLYHTHTGESISATFRVDGQYDRAVLAKLNHFLRDWRNDDQINMNPRLFDVIWETYRESGSRQPVHIVSAYRSPQTNAMLRRRSRAVAEHSQHILGKAMDMHYVDVPMGRVREIAMRLQRGGVGYYPTAGTPFVHLDVGSVRAWPRMSYDQLARLFPDGKTVHLPTNGHPLARYEEARAEIENRGDAPVMMASADQARGKGRGFFSRLFGIGEEDEDTGAIATPRGRTRIARATSADKDDAGAIQTPSERRAADQIARAERNLPRGETTMGAPGPSVATPVQVAAISILPPPRPAGLGAPLAQPVQQVAIADVPLPPIRPSALVSVAAAEKTPAPLPDLIRQGSEPAVAVLAYAPQAADPLALRGAVLPPSPPVLPQRAQAPRRTQLYAARLDLTNFTMLTQPAVLSGAMAQADLGMRPGLRPAVKAEGRAVALQASPLASAQLTALFADLQADRFTGAAVQPMRTAALALDPAPDVH